jgi:hypothetical protein
MAHQNIRIGGRVLFHDARSRYEIPCSANVRILIQYPGGGLLAKDLTNTTSSTAQTGKFIIVAGLILQFIWFVFFVAVAAVFHYRMIAVPTTRSLQPDIRWKQYLRSIYFVSILIMIRSLVRIIEYVQGYTGYILSHEVFLYLFDALLMLIVMVWMNWKHPSEISRLLRREGAKMDGVTLLVSTTYPKK